MRQSSHKVAFSASAFVLYSIHLMAFPTTSFVYQQSSRHARTFIQSIQHSRGIINVPSRVFSSDSTRRPSSPTTGGSIWQQIVTSSSLFSATEEVDPGVVAGLEIVKYPHPSLRAENDEITAEDLKNDDKTSPDSVHKLAKNMLQLMYQAEGVGLAAPQVGVNKRLMVYNPTGDSTKWLDETILVNPRIVEYSEAKDEEVEGCLSFPDMSGEVQRSKWIKVEAMNMRGKKVKKKYTGWEARIFQHEYDHLDGTVYIDRLSEETRTKVQPRLDELIEEYGEGGSI